MKLPPITVIDFETTGSVGDLPVDAWQIGLVRIIDGQIDTDGMFERLLHVGDRPFNPYAPGRHAELRSELVLAPTLQSLWPELKPWLQDTILCAHNIGTEKKILQQLAPLHRFGPWIDTLKLARIAWPQWPSHKLEDLVQFDGIYEATKKWLPQKTSHDALFDTLNCALLLQHMLALPGWEDVSLDALIHARPRAYHRIRKGHLPT